MIQAVNNTESIFTIQATFSTFGTRGKTKRMLDLVGPTLVDDETQIQMAIRRSLEESSQANETTSQKGKKQRGSGGAGRMSKFLELSLNSARFPDWRNFPFFLKYIHRYSTKYDENGTNASNGQSYLLIYPKLKLRCINCTDQQKGLFVKNRKRSDKTTCCTSCLNKNL